jgi:hypothetical protein
MHCCAEVTESSTNKQHHHHRNTSREAEGSKVSPSGTFPIYPLLQYTCSYCTSTPQCVCVCEYACVQLIYTHNVRHTVRSICAIIHVCTIPSWDKAQPVRDASRADPGSNPVEVVVCANTLAQHAGKLSGYARFAVPETTNHDSQLVGVHATFTYTQAAYRCSWDTHYAHHNTGTPKTPEGAADVPERDVVHWHTIQWWPGSTDVRVCEHHECLNNSRFLQHNHSTLCKLLVPLRRQLGDHLLQPTFCSHCNTPS